MQFCVHTVILSDNFIFGGSNKMSQHRIQLILYSFVFTLLFSQTSVLSQDCDNLTLQYYGIGAGGYAHSITFYEDGQPIKLLPDNVTFTASNNIGGVQVVLGELQNFHFHLFKG